jgi:hypothetical protein
MKIRSVRVAIQNMPLFVSRDVNPDKMVLGSVVNKEGFVFQVVI